jgi:hypothetical protein
LSTVPQESPFKFDNPQEMTVWVSFAQTLLLKGCRPLEAAERADDMIVLARARLPVQPQLAAVTPIKG